MCWLHHWDDDCDDHSFKMMNEFQNSVLTLIYLHFTFILTLTLSRMMLERCVIRKVIMQSFHSCNNILSNSHNWSTKKINDMSMSVRDEKILLVKKTTQMKSLQVVTTSDWRICNSSTALILKRLHHIDNVIE